MFARATSGDKINNRKFSPCSLKSIKPVLLSKAIGELTFFINFTKKSAEKKTSLKRPIKVSIFVMSRNHACFNVVIFVK